MWSTTATVWVCVEKWGRYMEHSGEGEKEWDGRGNGNVEHCSNECVEKWGRYMEHSGEGEKEWDGRSSGNVEHYNNSIEYV